MNTLTGYSKSRLTDNYVLTAAGGHLAVGNASNNIPLNNSTVNTNLNADLLDGLHGSWYLKNAISFKLTKGVAENQGYDVNTLTEGMVYNYGSAGYWKNGPSGMSYGLVLNLKNGSSNSLSGQLAWDVSHNNTTDTTRSLWWRASDNGTFTNAQWHKIAFLESIPNVTDYYWANIPISPESNDATTPKVLYLYATNGINTSYIRSSSSMSISSHYSITLSANDSSVIKIADTFINPLKDDTVNLGTPYDRWSAIYTKSLTTESLNYRCKGSNEYPTMYFFNDTWTYLGFFGINSEKKFVIGDQSGYSSNYVLHSGNSSVSGGGSSWGSSITVKINGTTKTLTIPANPTTTYDGRYVLKAGDTMTGPLTISTANWGNLLILNRVNNGENWGPSIIFKFDGTHNGSLTMLSNLLYVGDNGGVRYRAWHEGNDGSGSGLDADLLDGTHKTGLLTALSSSSSTNLSITVGGTTKSVTDLYARKLALSSTTITSTANDTTAKWGPLGTSVHFYATTGLLTNQPSLYGLLLNVTTGGPEVHLIWMTLASGNLYHRGGNSAGWSGSWRTILDSGNYSSYLGYIGTTAVLKSSAAQALTGITNATLSGKLTFTTAAETASISFLNGELIDGYGNVLLGTNSASWNVFNSSRSSLITVLKSGNVGIGTTSPSYKLHVNGQAYSTGYVRSGSSDSYVLLGGGGHKAVSDFATASHNHNGSYVYTGGMVNGASAVIPTYNGETGWHRIATIDGGTGYGSWILYLCGNWSWASNTNAILHINTMHTIAKITQVSGIVGFVTDVRLVPISANNYYVDVYINYSGANTPGTVYCYFLGNGAITTRTTAEKITASVSTAASITLVTGTKTNDNSYAAHFYENSDVMLKTNIKSITDSDNMPLLKEFDWKSDGSHGYGLIAQELEAMGYPELVNGELDGTKTVNYSAALSLIVGKLQVKIRELEKEIEILKKKN